MFVTLPKAGAAQSRSNGGAVALPVFLVKLCLVK